MTQTEQLNQLIIAAVDSISPGNGEQVARGMWEIAVRDLGRNCAQRLGEEAPIAAMPLYIQEKCPRQPKHPASKARVAAIAIYADAYGITYERSWARYQTYFSPRPVTAEATTLVVKGELLPAVWVEDAAPSGPLVLAPAISRLKLMGSHSLRDHLLALVSTVPA